MSLSRRAVTLARFSSMWAQAPPARGHGGDAGDVLHTGSLAPLLCAALDETGDGYALPDIQSTYALGGRGTCGRRTQSISMCWALTSMAMSRRLYGVGVNSTPAPGIRRRSPRWGEDAADLVVGVHHRYQTGIRPDSLLHLLGGTVRRWGSPAAAVTSKPCFSRRFREWRTAWCSKAVEMMCFLPFSRPNSGSGQQSLIVGLTAAGGEEDLTGLAVQAPGHGLTGALQQLGGVLAHHTSWRGFPVVVLQRRQRWRPVPQDSSWW